MLHDRKWIMLEIGNMKCGSSTKYAVHLLVSRCAKLNRKVKI